LRNTARTTITASKVAALMGLIMVLCLAGANLAYGCLAASLAVMTFLKLLLVTIAAALPAIAKIW
jgi:hypothetical protein